MKTRGEGLESRDEQLGYVQELTHWCRAPGCHQRVSRDLLMCPQHWRMVPIPVKREVVSAWAAVRRLEPGSVQRYRASVTAAVNEVFAKELNPDLTLKRREV